jgi:2-C-methyl-D-erythritol 2,4-cyclodiphosphate synthase
MYRIGNGIDFHKLENNPGRPFLLGGFEIKTELALVGHSDADILLHAIADAILGALSLGDIGQHFPDTDESIKGINSVFIINKVLNLMSDKKFKIVNVDSTIICEIPKISPYKNQILHSLSKILAIEIDCISVKATTTEKMGALGRKEGVGVFTSILLEKVTF